MTSPVPGGDPGKLWTFESEENKALVQRLAQEWSLGSEDEEGPAPALEQALTICYSPLPLSENNMAAVEKLAKEWTSGSENESGPAPQNTIPHSSLAIPEDNQASVGQLAEEWTSGSEAGNAAPASAAGNPTRLASLALEVPCRAVHKPPSLLNNGGPGVSQMRVAHHQDLLTQGQLDPWPMSGPLGARRMICPPTCSLMKECWMVMPIMLDQHWHSFPPNQETVKMVTVLYLHPHVPIGTKWYQVVPSSTKWY